MLASYEAEIGADIERPAVAGERKNPNFAVDWMIYYALFAIPIYIVCLDLQQGWLNSANHYLPIAYIGVCAAIVCARLKYNSQFIWTPITWFFVTSGLTFGLGPLIYYYGNEYSIQTMDTFSLMDDRMLLRTNLLNVVGTLMVCLGHFLVNMSAWKPKGERVPTEKRLQLAKRLFWRFLIIALPLKWGVFLPMYMDMFDFIVP